MSLFYISFILITSYCITLVWLTVHFKLYSISNFHYLPIPALKYESNYKTVHIKPTVRIFIYPWNMTVTDRWPIAYNHKRLSILPHYRDYYGAGKLIDSTIGLHVTHQYSLFNLFSGSLNLSKYLTSNPEEADYFFIPYDLGMDSSTRQSDGALTATNCPVLPVVLNELNSSPFFHRSAGRDHILIHSINQPMTFFVNRVCRQLYKYCINCIKLSIDTYSTETYDFLKMLPELTNRWYSVPFPSNFHLSANVTKPPWREILKPNYFPAIYQQDRPNFLCFVGSFEVTAKKQRFLRHRLINYCRQVGQPYCWMKILNSHSSNQYNISSSSLQMIEDYNPYARCRLCLCPGGDFPTRKAVLDALLAGCIPVIFEKEAALLQWPWHWGNYSIAESAVLYVDRSPLLSSSPDPMTAAMNTLIEFSQNQNKLKKSLLAIASVGDKFQYSLPYIHDPSDGMAKTVGAFEVIIEKLQQIKNNGYSVAI